MVVFFSYEFTLAVWLWLSQPVCCCSVVTLNPQFMFISACLFSCQLPYDDFFEILELYTTYDVFLKLRAYGYLVQLSVHFGSMAMAVSACLLLCCCDPKPSVHGDFSSSCSQLPVCSVVSCPMMISLKFRTVYYI
jgi:hypothetical protein